jgi:hypothetical protein
MAKRKGFLGFLFVPLLVLILASPVFADWYPAPIEYKQTMTVVVRESQLNTWLVGTARWPIFLATNVNGAKIAFRVKASNTGEDRIFVANADGTGLTNITPSLPAGVLARDVCYIQFNDAGTRLFFYHTDKDHVYYCNLSPLSCGLAVDNMYGGVPWIGIPYVANSAGTRLYFKYNQGYDPVAKKDRLGIYTASIGGTPTRLMHLDELPCTAGYDCHNMNRLKLLDGSADGNRQLVAWAPPEADKSMWMIEGAPPAEMMPAEDHYSVWDGVFQRVMTRNGNKALYEFATGSGSAYPVKLYLVDLNSGAKTFVVQTTDMNWFSFGPTISPEGKFARFNTYGYKSALADLTTGTKRDTWSYWFGESGCIGESNLTDLTSNGRYYFMGSRCDDTNNTKIHRVDTAPTSFTKAPHITSIAFNQPALLKDPGATVSVRAAVSDAQGRANIQWVKVIGLVNGLEHPDWLNFDPLTFGDARLFDDGTHGDQVANDGMYTLDSIGTTLNASSFFNTLPRYAGVRIIAKDLNGNYSIADTKLLVTNNFLPIVNVTATDAVASEPGTNRGTFTFSRTGSTAAGLAVKYSVSGSATNGVDYNTLSGSVTIPTGAATKTLKVTPIDDALHEGTENVKVTIESIPNRYYLGVHKTATIAIQDNEP